MKNAVDFGTMLTFFFGNQYGSESNLSFDFAWIFGIVRKQTGEQSGQISGTDILTWHYAALPSDSN